jgi:hypothetical protein
LRSWDLSMSDIFLAKYSATGQLAWARRSGGRRTDDPAQVVALRDGGALIAGSYYDEARFGSVDHPEATLAVAEDLRASFVARYDGQGHVVWARRFDGLRQGVGGLAVTDDGAAIVVGKFERELRFDGAPALGLRARGKSDIFVARYDGDGTPRWAQAAGGEGDDGAGAVAITGGDLLVVGGFMHGADFGVPPTRLSAIRREDAFVARYTVDGTLRWAHALGGQGQDYATAVALDTKGTAWLVGRVGVFDDPDAGPSDLLMPGRAEMFLASYDSKGVRLSLQHLTNSVTGAGGRRIAAGEQGRLYVVGEFSDALTLEVADTRTQLKARSTNDLFLAGLDGPATLRWLAQIAPTQLGTVALAPSGDGGLLLTGSVRPEAQLSLGERTVALKGGLFIAKLSQ